MCGEVAARCVDPSTQDVDAVTCPKCTRWLVEDLAAEVEASLSQDVDCTHPLDRENVGPDRWMCRHCGHISRSQYG